MSCSVPVALSYGAITSVELSTFEEPSCAWYRFGWSPWPVGAVTLPSRVMIKVGGSAVAGLSSTGVGGEVGGTSRAFATDAADATSSKTAISVHTKSRSCFRFNIFGFFLDSLLKKRVSQVLFHAMHWNKRSNLLNDYVPGIRQMGKRLPTVKVAGIRGRP